MVSDYLSHYKPSGNAWKAVCVGFLCVAIVLTYALTSNIRVKVKGAYDIDVQTGEGTQTITVNQYITQKLGL